MTLVRGLHERGIRPTVLAKRFDRDLPEYRWVDPVQLGVSGVPGKLRDLYFDWRIGRAKRRLGLWPLVACNQTRWSDIGICGSTHPGYLAAMRESAGRSDRWKIALERAHLEASRIVVAHSRRMHDEAVMHYGIDPNKIVTLYPPVDEQRFAPASAPERERLRAELGLAHDRLVFLLASTGHERKGLDLLAKFFATTTLPATLVVAGRPLPGTLANVRHLGYRRDIENVYRAVDCTVMASRYEPFGLVAVESVLSGTPVLIADNAGCAEVIRPPAAIGFTLEDPDSLEAAVRTAIDRWRSGTLRLDTPQRQISYDTRVGTHVDALLALIARVVAEGPHAARGT